MKKLITIIIFAFMLSMMVGITAFAEEPVEDVSEKDVGITEVKEDIKGEAEEIEPQETIEESEEDPADEPDEYIEDEDPDEELNEEVENDNPEGEIDEDIEDGNPEEEIEDPFDESEEEPEENPGYTVDLTYEEKTVNIDGDTTENLLSDVLKDIGIEDKIVDAKAYQDVDCTILAENGEVRDKNNNILFRVYIKDEEWYIDAVNSFSTEHGLWVKTVKAETEATSEYKIKVTDTTPNYLTFTAEEDNSWVSFSWYSGSDVMIKGPNNNTFVSYAKGAQINLSKGQSVQFKGTNVTTNSSNHFAMGGKIAASGDVTSLTNGSGGDVALSSICYYYMFNECTSLTTAPNLPSTTLARGCYRNMFYNCTSLTIAPELPAENLVNECYMAMFGNCTSLTIAPELPSTTLAEYCYDGMFSGCTSLTTAPNLPATALKAKCYRHMFYNCSKLTTVQAFPNITSSEDNCCFQMFYGCSALKVKKGSGDTLIFTCLNYEYTDDNHSPFGCMFTSTSLIDSSNSDRTPKSGYKYYLVLDSVCEITNGSTTTKYKSVSEAVAAAGSGNTITLTANTKENITVAEGMNITINLNGKTITAKDANNPVITNNGTLTLTDNGTTGGKVTGGAIGVKQNGTMTLSGKVNITGNTKGVEQNSTMTIKDDVSITGNTKGVELSGTSNSTTLEGKVSITGNTTNLYLPSGKTVTVSDGFNGKVGVTTEVKPSESNPVAITGQNSADYSQYFTSDNTYYPIINENNTMKLVAPICTIGTTGYASVSDAIKAAGSGNTIKILDNVTENITVANGKNITIDLNGKIITAKESSESVITNNGTLTLTDSSTTGGKVTGGAIGITQNGTMTLSGKVNITGNTKGVEQNSTMTIKDDVSITGNTKGVELSSTSVKTTLEGKVNITGSTESNLYLASDKTVVASGLTDGASIGVTLEKGSGQVTSDAGDKVKYFTSDVADYVAVTKNNHVELIKIEQGDVVVIIETGETYETLSDAINAATDGQTVKMVADTEENIIVAEEKNITIDLNGKTITAKDANESVITNNGTLTLTGSSTTGGKITGGATGVYQNGTMTLSGSINITGNTKGVELSGTSNTTTLTDKVNITENTTSNLYLPSGKTVTASNLTDGASIGVTTEGIPTGGNPIAVTGDNGTDYSKYFASDNDSYEIFNIAGTGSTSQVKLAVPVCEITSGGITTKYWSVNEAAEAAGTNETTIAMIVDTEENITVASGKNITIDLNGKTITAKNANNPVITNNGTLTLTDNGTTGGKVTGGVTGVTQNGTMTLSGSANITGNTKGIELGSTSNTTTLADKASVTDNEDGNLCLPSDKLLTVGEDFSGQAGITLLKNGQTSAGQFTTTNQNITEESEGLFFSDSTDYADKYNTDGYLELVTGYKVEIEADIKNGSVSVGNQKSAYEGEKITITATPNEGYELSGIKAYKTDEESISVRVANGILTMPAYDVTVSATFEKPESVPQEKKTVIIPVEDGGTVPVEAQIDGNKAIISDISAETIEEIITADNSTGTVTMDCTNTGSVISEVEIKTATVGIIANSNAKKLKVAMNSGSIALDKEALVNVSDEANSNSVVMVVEEISKTVLNDKQSNALETETDSSKIIAVVDSYILANTEKIKDLGNGTASLEINSENFSSDSSEIVKTGNIIVYEISEDGTMKKIAFKVIDGKIIFDVNKLSQYIIVAE